jgi:hypothetical protein
MALPVRKGRGTQVNEIVRTRPRLRPGLPPEPTENPVVELPGGPDFEIVLS